METPAATPAALALSTIGQIALSVTDIDRAIAFYRDTLGMKLLFQVPNMGFFDCGSVRLMLSGSQQRAGTSATVVYFRVPEIQQAFSTLKSRNADIEQEPQLVARMPDHELWMAFFRDPDGNLLALMSEVRGASS
jgi:methylmalonyl-CoA/ethylmalonyl-CoA epimerase